jgi:hypothetical protein
MKIFISTPLFWLAGIALLLAGCNAATPEPPAQATPTSSETAGTATPTEAPTPAESGAATTDATAQANPIDLLRRLLFETNSREAGQRLLAQIENSADTRYVAGLIDTMRYQRGLSPDISNTLNALTGANLSSDDLPFPDWHDWVEWAGQHTEIESFEDYDLWKSSIFSQIDPNFQRFVYPGMAVAPDSRVEEIVWGGVRVDGIPALDNPTMISPQEATYLEPQERVFGVSINGDTRAYPARFLDWHEMFNDVVGDEPVSLAY